MRLPPFLGLLLATTLVSACATQPKLLPNEPNQKKSTTASLTDISHLNPDQRSQLFYSILLARMAERKQFLDIAQSNYQDALEKTQSPQLAGRSTRIALSQKDYKAANEALAIWQKNLPESNSPKQIALLIAVHQDQSEKAYQQLVALYPSKTKSTLEPAFTHTELQEDFKQILGVAYSKTLQIKGLEQQILSIADLLKRYNNEFPKSPYANATKTAEAFLHLKSRSPLTHLERIHQQLDQVITESPAFIAAINTKTQALALISDDKASDFLREILQNQSLNKTQVIDLSNLAYRQKDYDSAIIGFERILDSEPENSEAQFLLAGGHFANQDYEEAMELFYALALDDYRKGASAYYCGDSAERIEDTVKSLTCFDMVPVGEYFLEARQRMATIYANQEMYKVGAQSLEKAQTLVDFNQRQMLLKYEVNYLLEYEQYELAKKRLESATQLEPHNGTIYYLQLLLADKTLNQDQFLAKVVALQKQTPDFDLRKEVTFSAINLLTQKQAHQQIIDLLDQEISLVPHDVDLLYTRALANEPLKRYDDLEQRLRHLLTLAPNHVDAQNALGYTLADLNKNLDEAKTLIEAAYQAKPDNDAILDSMGWIQYRLGNLPEALKYIQMSYDKSQATEIAAHLGEVLWQMGQTMQAIEVWKKALQQTPDNPYILDTLKRFPEANLLP